jgi:hypothetical protein
MATYKMQYIKNNIEHNWDVLLPLTNDKSFHFDSTGWVPVFGITLSGKHISPVKIYISVIISTTFYQT